MDYTAMEQYWILLHWLYFAALPRKTRINTLFSQ